MSPLPFRRRLRRPMRKMRNLTFSYGSYQPEKRHQRQQTGNERNQTLVSSSRQARRMAAQMDSGRSQRMASQRIRPVQKLARHGPATTCREPWPRLGYPCSRRRSRRQSTLRMVWCSYRIHLQHQRTAPRQLGNMVEGSRNPPAPFHWKRQHRVPLHRIPRHAESRRQLYPAGQRAEQRIPQSRRRQNLHFPQLGCMVARIPGGLPRQTGRTPLRTDRQRTGNERQRLHLERLPSTQ